MMRIASQSIVMKTLPAIIKGISASSSTVPSASLSDPKSFLDSR